MGKILQVKNLTASYPNGIILNDISFELASGDFTCLCGPNGCGKSTLLSCLANLQHPLLQFSPQSLITLDSSNIQKIKPFELAKEIAVLQQSEFCTWNFSVKDFVLQGRFCHSKNGFYTQKDYEFVNKNLEILNIENLADKNIHQISGGEFQKVRLARALTQNPSFLILDEPASNLDFTYEPKLMELLLKLSQELNIGIIISIHNLNIASQYAKKILLLSKYSENKSQLVNGTVSQIFTNENLKNAFNQDFTIFEHPINKSIQIC